MSVDVNEDLEEQRPEQQGLCRSLRRDAHVKCLVLTALIGACLAALAWCQCARVTRLVVNFHSFPITSRRTASPCEDGYVFIPVAFAAMLYLVYLVECWHCTTRIELAYKVDSATVYEHIQQMRETQPVIWWKAVCYHYVRRTRHVTRYRNGDAFTTTQVYYERVNSHGSGASFVYSNCGVKDISKKLIDLEKHPATKIRFSKGFAFANLEAANEFDEQRRRFFHDNERRDDYMEMCEGLDLVGVDFQEHMVAFAEPDRLPWYVSHMIFWIFSLALLSWPLRVLIQAKTAYVHYQVNKLFGVNYLTPSSELQVIGGCHMSRGTTIDSSEFERQILNNNTIAPSYSESLLIRSSSSFLQSQGRCRMPTSNSNNRFSLPTSNSNNQLPLPTSNSNNRFSFPTSNSNYTLPVPTSNSNNLFSLPTSNSNNRFSLPTSNSNNQLPVPTSNSNNQLPVPASNSSNRPVPTSNRSNRARDVEGQNQANDQLSARRFSTTGIPVSISRSSLQNGRVVYYVSPLEDSNNEGDRGPPQGQEGDAPPPSYDYALRHCRPLLRPLRRSITDRDIRRLPMVLFAGVHGGQQRDRMPLGEDIEENEPEQQQTSL